ncbi:MAG: enoyl-CoA hydratase/isomerase family protein, partial [Alphaproteobacteria bacterium]|nr:enoyl-CoA hydratase/isomerase family protein [Alphaproteobacteria bacterium]
MSEHIAVIEQAGVLEIHIDRPDKKNALTTAMYRAMTAALADASARADIGAVLFAGRGDAFCAGNDLKDFLAGPEGGAAAFAFIRSIVAFDKPLVAAVQGLAVGVGTTMLFHCDLIYAAPDARFVMPFVNLGIVPEAGSSLLAPALMRHAKAAA